MLENPLFTLALCLVLVIGLGFPISLILGARRRSGIDGINLAKRVAKRARNPWQAEDDKLKELAQKVEELKKKK